MAAIASRPFGCAAAGDDHFGARLREAQSGFVAEAAGSGAGDDGNVAGEIGISFFDQRAFTESAAVFMVAPVVLTFSVLLSLLTF